MSVKLYSEKKCGSGWHSTIKAGEVITNRKIQGLWLNLNNDKRSNHKWKVLKSLSFISRSQYKLSKIETVKDKTS